MPVTDPIADFCTRFRNASMRQHPSVKIPHSKIKQGIADVLVKEGFIEKWELDESGKFPEITLFIKYTPEGDCVVRHIERVSRPGLRVYSKVEEMKPVLNGQGITVVTTSNGVLSDYACRQQKVGGEVLCRLW